MKKKTRPGEHQMETALQTPATSVHCTSEYVDLFSTKAELANPEVVAVANQLIAMNAGSIRKLVDEVGPPPANDQWQTRAELSAIRVREASRTVHQVRCIQDQMDPTHCIQLFTTNVELQRCAVRCFKEALPYVYILKQRFNRSRPSIVDSGITPCLAVPNYPCYPSGYATCCYLIALVLSRRDPLLEASYIKIAHRITAGRELAGVQYHSDSEAGLRLACCLVNLLNL